MHTWMNLLLAVQLLTALVMIGLVLMQQGKGADMGASFGSGSSGSLFGASGSANFLSRSTAACATVFFLSTLALAFISNAGTTSTESVLDRAAPAASAPAESGGQIPTAPSVLGGQPAPVRPAAPLAPATGGIPKQ